MKFLWILLFLYTFSTYGRAGDVNLKVTTLFNPPWVTLNYNNPEDENSYTYDGYVVDLLKEVGRRANFSYTLQIANDTRHGRNLGGGKWDGMIGQILRSEADLAAGDLTITSDRSKVVDFSVPLMTVGIGLLIRRPPYFLESGENETDKLQPLLVYPYTNLQELANQDIVNYGALAGGSTVEFFKTSQIPLYKKIAKHLVKNADSLPRSYTEASIKVYEDNGKYAFFMEDTTIHYLLSKDCDYGTINERVGSRAFGIAMRKNFPYKSAIDGALVAMEENGSLQALKDKYFPTGVKCDTQLNKVYAKNIIKLAMENN